MDEIWSWRFSAHYSPAPPEWHASTQQFSSTDNCSRKLLSPHDLQHQFSPFRYASYATYASHGQRLSEHRVLGTAKVLVSRILKSLMARSLRSYRD
jgi:hypothetical protein